MELKKGMWVITNDRMKLGQIKDFCTCDMCKERGFYEPIITNNIYITDYDKSLGFHGYKFYENLIDLIQIGDYVNGMCVIAKDSDNRLYVAEDLGEPYYREFYNGCFDYTLLETDNFKIKDIVTKEQFNACKYVVERDTNENI